MVEVPSAVPAVKICGLTRIEDARAAAGAGADYLGAILSEGFRRSVDPGMAARFTQGTDCSLVGVLVDETPSRVAQLGIATGADLLQLHGEESPDDLQALRDLGPWRIWKAVRVRTGEEVGVAIDLYGPVADGLLLDGWHPEHRGGSGARFPWDLVTPLRDRIPPSLTVVVAGGLQVSNVAEAVEQLRPDVVDVSSGVEMRPGIKDASLVRAFIHNARLTQPQDEDR